MMGEYHDVDGNPVTLHKLCRTEPEWAKNRIETLLTEIERLCAMDDVNRRQERDLNVKIERFRPESERFINKVLFKYAVQSPNPTETVHYRPA